MCTRPDPKDSNSATGNLQVFNICSSVQQAATALCFVTTHTPPRNADSSCQGRGLGNVCLKVVSGLILI